MHVSLTQTELLEYTVNQLNHYFPDHQPVSASALRSALDLTLDKLAHCFPHVRNPHFQKDGEPRFNHLNSDQYAMYLYILSNQLHHAGGPVDICEKLFYLNKALHGIDCFYSIQLPPIFLFMHPLGTVLGKGEYGDYFFVSQNCSVGDNFDGAYPKLGKGVALYAGASVIGDCEVGDNCMLAADASIIKTRVPPNSLVLGKHPNNDIRTHTEDVALKHFY